MSSSSNPYADASRDDSNIPSYAVKGPVWDKPGSGPDVPGLLSDVFGTEKESPSPNKRLLGGTDPSEYKKYGIPDGAVKGPIYDTPGSGPLSLDKSKRKFDPSTLPQGTIVGPVYDTPGSDPVTQLIKGLADTEGQQKNDKRFDRQDSSIPSDVIVGPVYDQAGSDPISQFLGVGGGDDAPTTQEKQQTPQTQQKRCTTYKDIGSGYQYDVAGAEDYTRRSVKDQEPEQEVDAQPSTTRTVVAPTNSNEIISVPHFTATVPSKPDYLTNFKRDPVESSTGTSTGGAAPQATTQSNDSSSSSSDADAASQGAKYFPLNPNGDYSLVNPSNSFSPASGLTSGLSDVGSHFGLHQADGQQTPQQQVKRQFGSSSGTGTGALGGLNPLGSFGGGAFGGAGGAQGTDSTTPAPGSSSSDALGAGGAADGYSNFLAPVIDGKTYGLGAGAGAGGAGAAYAPSSSSASAGQPSVSSTAAPTARQEASPADVTITSVILKTITKTVDPVTYRGPTPSSNGAGSRSQSQIDPSIPTIPAMARRGLGHGFPTLEVPPIVAANAGHNTHTHTQEQTSVALVLVVALVLTSVFAGLLFRVRASLRRANANRIRLLDDDDDDDDDQEERQQPEVVEVKRA